jgi:protein tyrosine/serine phosphatase
MDIRSLLIQFAFLYAPLIHCPTEQVTPYLYRGGDPKIKDIYALHDKGIKTIISLRLNPQRKKARLCEKLSMNWVHIPTGVFLTPTNEEFDQFRSVVNDPSKRPCYAACEVDMDRTGVYIAAHRMVDQHWSAEQVDAEFKQHHQKTWWPPFRKYRKVVKEYAEHCKENNI